MSHHVSLMQRPATGILMLTLAVISSALLHAPDARPLPAAAPPPRPDLTLVGQTGGSLSAQAALGDRLGNRWFVTQGSRIVVYEVTDPTAPERVGESAALPGSPSHLAIEGSWLYATIAGSGLYIMDIGDRFEPVVVGKMPGVGNSITALDVDGGYAFVADGAIGLQVIDVRNPRAPRLEDSFEYKSSDGATAPMRIVELARNGTDLAVLAVNDRYHEPDEADTALIVLDALDPATIDEDGRVRFRSPWPGRLAWVGNHAYFGAGGMFVFDLTDSKQPKLVADAVPAEAGLSLGSVYATTRRLYVSALRVDQGRDVLVEYDLADAAAPRRVAEHTEGPWGGLLIFGQKIFSLDLHTLTVYDIRASTTPEKQGTVVEIGRVWDVASDGTFAYAVSETGLWALRADDPSNVVNHWSPPWTGVAAAVHQDRKTLYVAAGRDGLKGVYVADPTTPRERPGLPATDALHPVEHISIRGDRAYLGIRHNPGRGAGFEAELWVVDLSPPDGPVRLGAVTVPLEHNSFPGLVVTGAAALIASDPYLIAIDIRDPAAPREAGRVTLESTVWSVAAGARDTVYVGTEQGIRGFDASNPARLAPTVSLDTSLAGRARAVHGLGAHRDRLYALLAFPPQVLGPGERPEPGFGREGHGATLRSIKVNLDGTLAPIEDLDLAAVRTLPERVAVRGPFVYLPAQAFGLSTIRRAGGQGVYPEAHLPIAGPR